MEVNQSNEKHQELLDNVEPSIKEHSLYDNGIETLEKVQNTSAMFAKCHSTQPEEKELKIEDVNNGESRIERDSLEKETKEVKAPVKNQTSLAFTIDFGDNKEGGESTRYQNLFQKINARHKRNLSTSKIEIKAKKPVADLSPNFVQKPKPLSIQSEGYFSSEDDTKRKADRLSQKLKELGLKKGALKKSDGMSKSLTENSTDKTDKRRSYHEESTNDFIYDEMTYSSTMNDLSKVQNNSEEERNRMQYSPEKKYIKHIDIHNDYDDQMEKSSLETVEKLSNTSYLSDNCASNEFASSSSKQTSGQLMSVSGIEESSTDLDRNLDVFNVSGVDGASDETVSEAGTYTIHKDYTDEEKARMDIDKAFSVGILTEEESNETYVHHFKLRSSRDTNTWITEWATQVAEHNSLPPIIGGTKGRTPPMSPSKIPSPVYSRCQRVVNTSAETRRTRYEQSDSSLDADIQQMRDRIMPCNNQHTNLIDSGGESDEDTSNSYNTPQRTPTHHSALVRRGSLSESLFKRVNHNDTRRSMRKYPENMKKKEETILVDVPKSPSHVLARLHLQRGNSLDRKSDTAESNSSRRSSLKNYQDDSFKHTNSPILNRLRPTTPKLTNSPIMGHKTLTNKILNSPSFERPKQLMQSQSSGKNVGYFTCVENSPYMLRKSHSTSNYQENTYQEFSVLNNSPMLQRNSSIQRSSSNTSIRNTKSKSILTRRSSFNDQGNDRITKIKHVVSDSSSETGDQHPVPPIISSGIKLNRAFSIRRARVTCDSDTTPNTTPEERRRKAQMEIKSAPTSARQASNHHRGRTSSVGASNRADGFKKPEVRARVPSLSRNEGGRYSVRGPKAANSSASRPSSGKIGPKDAKNGKNSGRSNSTLTSKEIEFQNWKRRKNYDPMKAAAEGKKKLDGSRKHHSIEDGPNSSTSRDNSVLRSASFHGTRGALSLADDWSDNELNYEEEDVEKEEVIQIPPPCSPLGSDSDLDTSSYLQTTQNVMTAMSARITVYQPAAPVDSGGESDEDTSHSLRQSSKMAASDTESSDDHRPRQQQVVARFNKNLGMRKNQELVKSAPAKMRTPGGCRSKGDNSGSIARTDSGRMSMRMSKSAGNAGKGKPKDMKKQAQSNAREQEMLNWKRRKSYDPMKAAMEGKRKAAGVIKKSVNSESSSVLRSQSFHGPVNFGISEWSDEDVSASADEAPIY